MRGSGLIAEHSPRAAIACLSHLAERSASASAVTRAKHSGQMPWLDLRIREAAIFGPPSPSAASLSHSSPTWSLPHQAQWRSSVFPPFASRSSCPSLRTRRESFWAVSALPRAATASAATPPTGRTGLGPNYRSPAAGRSRSLSRRRSSGCASLCASGREA